MRQAIAIAVTPGIPTSLRQITVDVPDPGPTEVLIDVIRGGVCGTDREIIAGHIGHPPEGSDLLILGHEMMGRVRATGTGVTGLSPGDLVTATVRRPDGCPLCVAGQPDMCIWDGYTEHGIRRLHGFLSQHVVVGQEWVVQLPDALEATGLLVEPLTVVEKAIRQIFLVQQRMATWEPRTAIVLGAGPIGILTTMVLRSLDIDVFTAARTLAPNRAAMAVEQTGAEYVSTREEPLDALVRRLPPVDIVVECTGAAQMSHQAVTLPGKNGAVVLLSVSGHGSQISVPADSLNHTLVPGNAIVLGSVNAGRDDWDTAVNRLASFEDLWPGLTESLITKRIPFDGDISAIAQPDDTDGIKTVIEFT